jgi:hypothetical protein
MQSFILKTWELQLRIIKDQFVMLLTIRSYKRIGSQLKEHKNIALPLNTILLFVHKVGFTFVSFQYNISKKWMFIFHLHLEKLKCDLCPQINYQYKRQKVFMVNVRI